MRILLTVVLSLVLMSSLLGQDSKKQEAKEFFVHQRYAEAFAVLSSSRTLIKEDQEARFLLAICHYQLNELDQAKLLLKAMIRDQKEAYPECWWYMGKVFHATHQFEKAASYYKDYLRRLKPNHPNRAMARDAIRRCANGMEVQFQQSQAIVENLGPNVNSEYDEFAPIISPNYSSKLYFSSIRPGNNGGARNKNRLPDSRLGKFYSDMFSCELKNGSWGNIKSMHYLMNSPQHEVLLDFSSDGSVLYYFKGWTPQEGQIYVDTFKSMDERYLSSDPFQGPVSPAIGDNKPFFVSDKVVYFSSSRPGGYGGLDIYKATFSNGRWSAPKNLGPVINSPYDETTPFLARDGRTLYFSSNNREYSIGGLDILKAVFNEQSERWTIPANIGTPINSAADDADFRISKDGFTAYFSSARKDGMGQRDLYAAYFNSFLPEMELPLANIPDYIREPVKQEVVTKPAQDMANVPAPYDKPKETNPPPKVATASLSPIYYNSGGTVLTSEGKATLDEVASRLKADPSFIVVITVLNKKSQAAGPTIFNGILKAEQASRYLVGQGVSESAIFMKSGLSDNNGPSSLNFAFYSPSMDGGGSKGGVVKAFASPGHILNKDLVYKVQVFSLKGSSTSSLLDKYPDAMVEKKQNVAFYRYTLGAFETHAAANAFRQQLIRAGQKSAFIVPYIYGMRADKMMARRNIITFPDLASYAQ
jgi:tetratricopeptide (TPR) repeat protein